MHSEIKVSLLITNFPMTPEAFAVELGVKPTRTMKVGEPMAHRDSPHVPEERKKTLVRSFNAWILDSGLNLSADLEAHVASLLQQVRPTQEKLKEISHKYPLVLSCVIKSYGGDRPAIHFDQSVVKELASICATIDIDLYVFE